MNGKQTHESRELDCADLDADSVLRVALSAPSVFCSQSLPSASSRSGCRSPESEYRLLPRLAPVS